MWARAQFQRKRKFEKKSQKNELKIQNASLTSDLLLGEDFQQLSQHQPIHEVALKLADGKRAEVKVVVCLAEEG